MIKIKEHQCERIKLYKEISDITNIRFTPYTNLPEIIKLDDKTTPVSTIPWIALDVAGTKIRDDAWYFDGTTIHIAIAYAAWLIDTPFFENILARPVSIYDVFENVRERMLPSVLEQMICLSNIEYRPALVMRKNIFTGHRQTSIEFVKLKELVTFDDFDEEAPKYYRTIFDKEIPQSKIKPIGIIHRKQFAEIEGYEMCPSRIFIKAILEIYNVSAGNIMRKHGLEPYVYDVLKATSPLRDLFCLCNQYMLVNHKRPVIDTAFYIKMYKRGENLDRLIQEN